MSMNLAFRIKSGGIVDFPFQTPTDLTRAVLAEKNNDKRIELLDNAMKEWGWDKETISDRHSAIVILMKNKSLKLIEI